MMISEVAMENRTQPAAAGWIRHAPNVLSVLRLLLVVPIADAIESQHWPLATLMFIVAAISDMADGAIARVYNARSTLGEILDPLADKALLVTTALALANVGQMAWWLAFVVLVRDLMILAGALVSWLLRLGHALLPLLLGKASTVSQMALMLAILLAAGEHNWAVPLILPLKMMMVSLAAASGGLYVLMWKKGLPEKSDPKKSRPTKTNI